MQKTNKNIACEKSPPNAYSIAAALQSRSDIKAIFTVRNFNHVVRSLEKRGNTFEVAIVRWLSKVTMAINAQRRFGKQRVLIVRYEDLVKEPENEINKLLDFIGLPKNRLDVESMLQCKSERIQNDKTLAGEKGASSSWEFLPSDGIQSKKTVPRSFSSAELAMIGSAELSSEMVQNFSGLNSTFLVASASEELGYDFSLNSLQKLYKFMPFQKNLLSAGLKKSSGRLPEFCRLFAEL